MSLKSIQQQMEASQFDDAIQALDALLTEQPENIDALYMAAVCHRYTGQLDTALSLISRLKTIAPAHGRTYQEEGHSYRALGNEEAALHAYQQAVQVNPSLIASYRGQFEILTNQKRLEPALIVRQHLEQLLNQPKPLLAVMDLIAEGKLVKAEDLCRAFLKKIPHHPEAVRLLAEIGTKLGVMDEADFLLESLVLISPDNHRARMDYIQVLRKRQKYALALAQAKILLDTNPLNPQYRSLYAIEQMQTGDFDAALANFDRVLEQVPEDPITLTSRGHALKTVGKQEDAITSYRRALRSKPDHGEAYYSLANLKTYRFSDSEFANMLSQEKNSNLSAMERTYLYFALAKAHEDKADFDMAFSYYQSGNSIKKAQSRYDAKKMSAEMAQQISNCTASLFSEPRGYEAADPIFILGLPRAGSTLLEQILSSHSQVDGTMELPNILSLSHQLKRETDANHQHYPASLPGLDATKLRALGEAYIEDTRVHRSGAAYFIDKMPNNFRHIGLIHLILPNAKIIDARRHPMACCFSGFKQLFAEGQEFSYSLEDIGQYYRDYVSLMDHWDQVMPGAVLRVQHEEVVADLEGQVQRILKFCDLPFEQACVEYHKTERNVRTPSSEQVRQPIFQTSLDQWRSFESHLAPLADALGEDLLKRYPINQV